MPAIRSRDSAAGSRADRPRRTQSERSTATRIAILDATIRCLVELGYGATTTSAIQEQAGVSRGALTHQFPLKRELMIAAVGHLNELRTTAMLERVTGAPAGRDRIAFLIRVFWEDGVDTDLFHAAIELWTASRADPKLRSALQESERLVGRRNRERLAEAFPAEIANHPNFRRAYAVAATHMRGAVLTNLIRKEKRPSDDFVAECVRIFRNELDDSS